MKNDWIEEQYKKAKKNAKKENTKYYEKDLIDLLIEKCIQVKTNNNLSSTFGELLAASFDLMISAEYYKLLSHSNWFYCPDTPPRLYYHYTNCCPRHALGNIFHFNKASKPESAKIGQATSKILRLFYQELLLRLKREEKIYKGSEPIDLIIVNEKENNIFFAEIKASPLLTVPLAMKSEKLVENGKEVSHKGNVTCNKLKGEELYLFIPYLNNDGQWVEKEYKFGQWESGNERWSYDALYNLIKDNNDFFIDYLKFWVHAFKKYGPKEQDSVFWLTNSCGAPKPKPSTWPLAKKGKGTNSESISDSKTSVGMDRTDDIKKGTYQVLKINTDGKYKNKSKWKLRVGILTNIHAIRHFEEYLDSVLDLIWTVDKTKKVKKASDLAPDYPLYNLFDGVVALTESYFRDEWLEKVFGLDKLIK